MDKLKLEKLKEKTVRSNPNSLKDTVFFSDKQIGAFNAGKTNSLDDVLKILDEDNKTDQNS